MSTSITDLEVSLADSAAQSILEYWLSNSQKGKSLVNDRENEATIGAYLKKKNMISYDILEQMFISRLKDLNVKGGTIVEKVIEVEKPRSESELRRESRERWERMHAEGIVGFGGAENNRSEFDRETSKVEDERTLEQKNAQARKHPSYAQTQKLISDYFYEHLSKKVYSVTEMRQKALRAIIKLESDASENWVKTYAAVQAKIKEHKSIPDNDKTHSAALAAVVATERRVQEARAQAASVEDNPLPPAPAGFPPVSTMKELRALSADVQRRYQQTPKGAARIAEIIKRSGATKSDFSDPKHKV